MLNKVNNEGLYLYLAQNLPQGSMRLYCGIHLAGKYPDLACNPQISENRYVVLESWLLGQLLFRKLELEY